MIFATATVPVNPMTRLRPQQIWDGLVRRGRDSNYLAGRLRAAESWRFEPPTNQTISRVALSTGRLHAPEIVEAGELAIFEASSAAIDFNADTEAEFVIGSTAPSLHDLVLAQYSVHSSPATLPAGEQRLSEIQRRLQGKGGLA
jgi:hypothetical protein